MPLLFKLVLEILAREIKKKYNKKYLNCKGSSKTVTIFKRHITIYRKPCRRKKAVRTNTQIQLSYRIQGQKPVVFLYTNNQKLRKQSHLQLHQKKYLQVNLTKEVKGLYTKNHKTESFFNDNEHTKKWKDISCSYTRRIL